ncbi:prenylcysteine oxidase [Arthroderma uncinatum]|uniref:prenylcysteine oxidase n=1 Tax=Arthroderma uncinatum TaxID=74035 RepID=UPI00144AD0D5|nr:prenylcysteine oxidase [Arthroderma uncinatum]KAF3490926.1 prenylcysteine oxidase [Arthroderma uncinatum]
MHIIRSTLVFYVLLLSGFVVSQDAQRPLGTELPASPKAPKRVAVIGAGSGGSSAAYYLRTYADYFSVPINITIFERSPHVGGRSTTVNVFDDPSLPIELGASIFVEANKNLMKAAKTFGLTIQGAGDGRPKEATDSVGVWDGTKFVFQQREGNYRWWNILQLLWRYGWAPMRTQDLMKSTIDKFLKLYQYPLFPWKSLSEAARSSGLIESTWATGAEFLKANHISEAFSREIIQASTRVNYGQNLPLIHGLETMVCMAAQGAVSIRGGNWQIFRGMAAASKAVLNLETEVTNVKRREDNAYAVSYVTKTNTTEQEAFDHVVLAAPLQFSGIKLGPTINNRPDEIPYVKLYVTLFSSPHKLSPKYFNLPPNALVPETVLTTLPKGLDLGHRRDGVGPTGFWSISTLQKVRPPVKQRVNVPDHYVYKVFSPEPLSTAFLSGILGIKGPAKGSISDFLQSDISWSHEKLWHSYPVLYPRVTFEEIQLAPNLWYTSGIESLISTMETSSLSGMNVAALMVSQETEDFKPKMNMFDYGLL